MFCRFTEKKRLPINRPIMEEIESNAIKIRYDLTIAYLVDIWRSQNSNETTESVSIYLGR